MNAIVSNEPLTDFERRVRGRLWSHLDPGTAGILGVTVHQLQQIAVGEAPLTPEQIETLAALLGVSR